MLGCLTPEVSQVVDGLCGHMEKYIAKVQLCGTFCVDSKLPDLADAQREAAHGCSQGAPAAGLCGWPFTALSVVQEVEAAKSAGWKEQLQSLSEEQLKRLAALHTAFDELGDNNGTVEKEELEVWPSPHSLHLLAYGERAVLLAGGG